MAEANNNGLTYFRKYGAKNKVFPAGNYIFKVNNKDTRMTPMTLFCCLYC